MVAFLFRQSRVILTDLSFFMVITAGDTKQFSVVLSAFSRRHFPVNFSISCRIVVFYKWMVTGLSFFGIGLESSFSWMSFVKSFIV